MPFEELLAEYGPMLSRVAATYESDPELQRELTQEICLAVWQAMGAFSHKSSLKTYLLRIAHNRAVTHVNKQVREPSNNAMEFTELELPDNAHQSAEAVLAEQQAINQLVTLVRSLPINARQVMTLAMEGVNYNDIAEILGLSPSNVGVLLNRAKQQLKSKFHAQ
ncbi:RNA polymerase sigma factor [Alteromonas flava]|uniref:RNA polymerase sigma factor n=1 Tax=Alteromonas flava TaxID=2048003 RepID=UPI000C28E73C|nr:sigma-70 family RNA polymerase sigma factor [Alteromonas flava]